MLCRCFVTKLSPQSTVLLDALLKAITISGSDGQAKGILDGGEVEAACCRGGGGFQLLVVAGD